MNYEYNIMNIEKRFRFFFIFTLQ